MVISGKFQTIDTNDLLLKGGFSGSIFSLLNNIIMTLNFGEEGREGRRELAVTCRVQQEGI